MSVTRLSARGAIVMGSIGVLTADRLNGSFAAVDTHGQAGVPVFRDNRRIGRTDRRGRLIVGNLRAYEPTKISLEPMSVGDWVLMDRTEQWAVPAARAGVPVRFLLRTTRAVRVRLVNAYGVPIPAGSRATANGRSDVPVGLDGELYLEEVGAENAVTVRLRGEGQCVARFGIGSDPAPLTCLGPVVCKVERIAAG